MDLNNLTTLTFFAPLVLFWQQSRNFINSIFSLFIRNDKIRLCGNQQNEFISFCKKRFKEIKFGNLIYRGDWGWPYLLKEQRYINAFLIFKNKYIFLYKNFIPFVITPYPAGLKILYPNLFNFEKILLEFNKQFNDRQLKISQQKTKGAFWTQEIMGRSLKEGYSQLQHGGPAVASPGEPPKTNSDSNDSILQNEVFEFLDATPPLGYKENELIYNPPITDYSKYYFSKEGLEVLHQVESWLDSREWYEKRQIAWRRGILLYGQPGTGKSELIKQIAKKLGIGIYIVKLNTLDDQEFVEKTKGLIQGSIILIEDFDSIFNLRENLHEKSISFGSLINAISGVDSLNNHFLFITTNHIDKLDPAIRRSGRIDAEFELSLLCQEGKKFIANKILGDWPALEYNIVNQTKAVTAAEFENLCVKTALEEFWKNKL